MITITAASTIRHHHRCKHLLFAHRFITHFAPNHTKSVDIVVVGGGIVGCATARQLKLTHPHLSIALVEKEHELAFHQSGRNSGVVHAGIYYQPGSLKAKLCVRGMQLTYDYCDRHRLPYKKVGKLIVAVESSEIAPLHALFERAKLNRCPDIELVDANRIREIEPHCKGIKAIWSPHSGIINFGDVTRSYANDFQSSNGDVYIDFELVSLAIATESAQAGSANVYPVSVRSTSAREIRCKYVITCAGLQADRVSQLSGCSSIPKIVPFRGEYLLLKPEKRNLVKTNIYPVPDARFPFLGVHFTPRMNGDIWLGPNAVLAYEREGYRYTNISIRDMFDALSFPGMQKLMLKYGSFGAREMYRSFSIGAQVRQLQRFVPELKVSDVIRGPAGVRAQALDAGGNLVDDFVFDGGEGSIGGRLLHVRNAPSPGATSSLAIAEMIDQKATEKFGI